MKKMIKDSLPFIEGLVRRSKFIGMVNSIKEMLDYMRYYDTMLKEKGIYDGTKSSYSHIGHYTNTVRIQPSMSREDIFSRIPRTITHGVYKILGINRRDITYDKYAMYMRMIESGINIPNIYLVTDDLSIKIWPTNNDTHDLRNISLSDKVLAKPRFANSGIGIHMYNGEALKKNYIYQEFVLNHERIRSFQGNDYCGTVRYVVFNDKSLVPLDAFIRFNPGRITDHAKYGAVCSMIDLDSGELCSDGFYNNGLTCQYHPVSGKEFIGFKIPNWESCIEEVEKVCAEFKELPLIAFDLAITELGCKVLEINAGCGTQVLQYSKGLLNHPFVQKYYTIH